MQTVEWTDEDGRRRVRLVRDALDDPREGIPLEPPDVDRMDWHAIQRDLGDRLGHIAVSLYALGWDGMRTELHNQLLSRGLLGWEEVQASPRHVRGAVLAALAPVTHVAPGNRQAVSDAIFAALRRPLLNLYREHLHRG